MGINTIDIWIAWLFFVSLCVFIFAILKGYEIYSKRKKFENNKSEFCSDLFKIQMKWSKRGESEFGLLISKLIEAVNIPDDINKFETKQGKQAAIEDLKREIEDLEEE